MQGPNTTVVSVMVLMEDDLIHTDTHPFCQVDPHCPCHEDQEWITQVARFVDAGLLTPAEATHFVTGTLLDWEEKEARA